MLQVTDELLKEITDINRMLDGNQQSGEVPELWDGLTSERILKVLIN
jgi:hypothetical protein